MNQFGMAYFLLFCITVSQADQNMETNLESSIEKSQKRLEEMIGSQKDLEEKIDILDKEIALRRADIQQSEGAYNRAKDSLKTTKSSEERMMKTLIRDRERLESIEAEIERTKRHLKRLEESAEILKTNIDSDRESLERVANAREKLEDNLNHSLKNSQDSQTLLKELEAQKKKQNLALEKITLDIKKWVQQLDKLKLELEQKRLKDSEKNSP
jgi:septal ring factor EnvC (AmiA/AmiB activator)